MNECKYEYMGREFLGDADRSGDLTVFLRYACRQCCTRHDFLAYEELECHEHWWKTFERDHVILNGYDGPYTGIVLRLAND